MSGFPAVFQLSSLDGVAAYDQSGISVSASGDVNGDGFADLIVGAYGADPNGPNSGSSYVIFGQRAQAAVTITGTTGGTRDVIADVRVHVSSGLAFIDRIDVSAIDAVAGVDSHQAFTFIGTAAFSGEGQIRAVQDGASTNVLFNTTGRGGAEMVITLRNFTATDLTAADFIL